MYHLSQRVHESTQLARLSLAKFSHTTTSIHHNGPLNWSHVFSNGDIVCCFHKVAGGISSTQASTQSSLFLRVFQDQNIMEEVDLGHFIQEISGHHMSGQSGQSRPVFAVVVKLPCLAVKYPTGNGFIRRFQLKFSSDREFYTALAILSDIRCPFSESNVGSSQLARRPTSSQWHSRSVPSNLGIREPFPSSASAAVFPVLSSASALGSASSITAASSLPPSSSGTAHATAPDRSGTGSTNNYTELEARPPQGTIQPHTEEETRADAPSATPKPATTAACHDIRTLSQLLPPKRELPFSKPPAKRSRTTAKEPSTTSQTLSAADQIPTNSKSDAAPPSSSQAPKKPSPRRKAAGALKRSTTSIPPLTLIEEPPTQPMQSISSLAQPATIPGTQQVHVHEPNSMFECNNSIVHQREQQQDPTAADLSSYLSVPTQERTARLENWICQNIENDGFIKLCQDVEGIWRRIAFGS